MNTTAKTALMLTLTALLGVTASSAMAETQWEKHHPRRDQVNDRLQKQDRRIHHEVKEGEMSKQAAHKLHRDDRQVRQEERGMARQNGGAITQSEQHTLNQQENGISKQISH